MNFSKKLSIKCRKGNIETNDMQQ